MQLESVGKHLFIFLLTGLPLLAWSQKDTARQPDTSRQRQTIVEYLKTRQGLFGKLAENLVGDTVAHDLERQQAVRIDRTFQRYEGLVIRNIAIQSLDFGTLITDTAHNFKNTFTNLANALHRKSREQVIRNYLFFRSGDKVMPFLLADNERLLRDQAFIQDAKIMIIPLASPDSVDIFIRTKDVLSIGGTLDMASATAYTVSVKEDNLAGLANSVSVGMLFNNVRHEQAGYSFTYLYRNIAGSFIDGSFAYTTYGNTFNTGQKEEESFDLLFLRPLINPYAKLTYSLELANHVTHNMFWTDSLYNSDIRYKYFNYDAWIGWNTGATRITARGNEDDRMRTLVSLRYFRQQFQELPDKYVHNYFYQYADITGVLGAISIFKQNFYKTKYMYGFGRNEDVPEGLDVSLTAGWVNKQQTNRPYLGIDLQRYFFTKKEAYFNFFARVGAFWNNGRAEDVNMLAGIEHYSRLHELNKWKQRFYVNASLTGQVNAVYNAPLYLQSQFGLNEWTNSLSEAADIRATLRAESVFFSPFSFINFRFAPFIFTNLCMMTPVKQNLDKSDLYSSVGGGIRTRNESLIFGTFELRIFYFPRKTFTGDSWRVETTTGIRFKYNSQYVKKPTLISVN